MEKLKRSISVLLVFIMCIVSVGANAPIHANADIAQITIYFVDATAQKWIANDSAVIELVDNTKGHDRYAMTTMDNKTWSAKVPASAYNITFNRYNKEKTVLWNSWSAGGRDGKITYTAEGTSNGRWTGEVVNENCFQAGDVVYLDLTDYTNWLKDNAVLYVNFTNATKSQNVGNDVIISSANKSLYNPVTGLVKVEGNIYSYKITERDAGASTLRFWRGNNTTLWNCSISLSYKEYEKGYNCVKVAGWSESGSLKTINLPQNHYTIVPEQSEYEIEIGKEEKIYFCIADEQEESQCNFSYQVIDKDNIVKEYNQKTDDYGLGEITVSSDIDIDTVIIIQTENQIQKSIKLKFCEKQPSITERPHISYEYAEAVATDTLDSIFSGAIILSWRAVKNADEYEIYKSCNGEDYECVKVTKDLEFTDGELQSGFTYSYYVKAVNEEDESEKSNEIQIDYIKNIENIGDLTASTTSIYKGINQEVVFQIAPPEKLMDNVTIKVEQLDDKNQVISTLTTLKDNGDVAQGDDIAGDGIYSGKVLLNKSNLETLIYRASVILEIGGKKKELYSSISLEIGVIEKLSNDEISQCSEFIKEIQNQYKSLEYITGQEEKAKWIEEWLNEKENVRQAGISEQSDSVYCVLNSGIKLVVPLAKQGLNSLGSTDTNADTAEKYLEKFREIKEASVLAYLDEKGNISLEDYKSLYQYVFILLNVSGEMYEDIPYLCTNDAVTNDSLHQYEQDIKEGTIILVSTPQGLSFGVLPQYIEKYNKRFDDSIIFLTASKSMQNEVISEMFEALGAACVFGFRDNIRSEDAQQIADFMIEALLTDGLTTEQAYDWVMEQLQETNENGGIKAFGTGTDSNFACHEVTETQLEVEYDLNNGSFEKDLEGWTVSGDAKTITCFGSLVPPDGNKMAVISTLGNDSNTTFTRSNLTRRISVTEDNAIVNITYNVISEKPLDYADGRNYHAFHCTIDGQDLYFVGYNNKGHAIYVYDEYKGKTVISESVFTSKWLPADGINFCGEDNTAIMTGWVTVQYDLSAYIGKTLDLQFSVEGYKQCSSAVLIDNIFFTGLELEEDDTISIMWPTESKKIMSYFGETDMVTEQNRGLNIMSGVGESVMSAHEGTVTDISYSEEYGNYIEIETEWDEISLITRYANVRSIEVEVGEEVESGQEIAEVANRTSIGGTILHFEVIEKQNSKESHVDPYQYLVSIPNQNLEELDYLSQPYFTVMSAFAVNGASIFDDIRYAANLDLENGEVYLEKLYPALKDKKDSIKIKSSKLIAIKLNGKTKSFGTDKKYNNAKLINGHLVVNLNKFMRYFYKEYSEIPSSYYNKNFKIGEKKYYSAVYKLQSKLKALGYCNSNGEQLNCNGYLDLNTAYALVLFSSAHGLNITKGDNEMPGTHVKVNSAIWFTLFSGRAKKYEKVIKEVTFVPKTKNLLKQYCYIFYLPEWEKEAKDNKKEMAKYFNMADKNVIIKPISANSHLTNGWNEMDMIKKQKVYIKAVILNTHASNSRLGYNHKIDDKFGEDEVASLKKTYIEYLILYGCNAAHQDYPNNIASLFAKKNRYRKSMGSDGSVQSDKRYNLMGEWIYKPLSSDAFKSQSKDAGASRTSCDGFIKISYDSKGNKNKKIIGKNMTLSQLLQRY